MKIVAVAVLGILISSCSISDGTNGLNVVAPDYLQGILEKAAAQFIYENGTAVNIQYVMPDSIVKRTKSAIGIDLFLKGNPGWFEILSRDTLLIDDSYSCPFRLAMVLVGRADGPAAEKIEELTAGKFHRIVIVDPYLEFEGKMAQKVIDRRRMGRALKPKLIKAKSAEHLRSYLTTGEADAAIMFESSMSGIDGLVVLQNLDKGLDDQLVICGAVTAKSKKKAMAQAFLDLLDSRLCPIYKVVGIYQHDDR
jgi:molybdate transport system substrate-binding protein